MRPLQSPTQPGSRIDPFALVAPRSLPPSDRANSDKPSLKCALESLHCQSPSTHSMKFPLKVRRCFCGSAI